MSPRDSSGKKLKKTAEIKPPPPPIKEEKIGGKWLFVVTVAFALRILISLHPYSGYAKPPMFGDFEAQRHWQEITVNLPISQWYQNGTYNDLSYWGLDYPPLTAYHSYVMGRVAKYLNESYVSLWTSRGITDDNHKLFMRWTVLLADILIYFPAMLLCCKNIYKRFWKYSSTDRGFRWLHVAVAIMYPGQILIDNGHFQYNNISLGLAVLTYTALLKDHLHVACFTFVMALNYKQMELYHALPIFCYLLAHCFKEPMKM